MPYTPQQNGVAERKNIDLKEMETYMLEANDLNPNLWNQAKKCVAYIKNRDTHIYLDVKTPYEAWFGHKPSVSHLRVFGSKAWDKIPPEKRKALKPQSKDSMMVGYAIYEKGYKLFDP